MTFSSCIPGEPLVKLAEGGHATVLDYSLPQSTAYDVVSLLRLDIPRKRFKGAARAEPENNYWGQLKQAQLEASSIGDVLTGKKFTTLAPVQDLGLKLNSTVPVLDQGLALKTSNVVINTKSLSFAKEYVAHQVAAGLYPQVDRRPSGRTSISFQAKPARTTPALHIVLKLRMVSFADDFGAGKVLKTFSLLPGEQSTISIRTYEEDETTSVLAQSVLDSYSESCTDELQSTIESKVSTSSSWSDTDTNTMSADVGFEAHGSLDLGLIDFGGGFEAEGSLSSVRTTTQAVEQQVEVLTSSMEHHVQTADTKRQIEINAETTTSSTTSSKETITRTLENINKSRVLNFVFRQLLQAYTTITYVHDVEFHYSNGYPESRRSATLATLNGLLDELFGDEEDAERVRNRIYETLCNIQDVQGDKVSLIETAVEEVSNCIVSSKARKEEYVRVRKGLSQSYGERTVPGIVLSAKQSIVRTPSVIVEALLGQGEALDCYNMRLQDAAAQASELSNTTTQQMLDTVGGIEDASERATLYKKVFGDCCETAESGE